MSLLFLALGCEAPEPPPPAPVVSQGPHVPSGAACSDCHAAETSAWSTSHHAAAMSQPDAAFNTAFYSAFNNKEVLAGTLRVTPLRAMSPREGTSGLLVRVADKSGEARTFPVKAVIGVAPLRQPILEGEGGRFLVSPIAWDVANGRWFDPSVEGAVGDPHDPLRWDGLTGTWNHMCAGCHTTTYDEGFDPESLTYTSTWTDFSVSCTACHGLDGDIPLATAAQQIDTCGPCHSRGTPVLGNAVPGAPLVDRLVPDLLDGPVFAVDGGIQAGEEAFEVGPFLQSRMYQKGVRCSDCHEPHAGTLRADGNALCTACHDAATFDTRIHTRHSPVAADGSNSLASRCVTCHMPTRTYMGVDVRHDHYIRVPDPPLSASLGLADPCTTCHGKNLPGSWLTTEAKGVPPQALTPQALPPQALARLFTAARAGDVSSVAGLQQLLSDPSAGFFRRASAAAALSIFPPSPGAHTALLAASRDPDPLLRLSAVRTLSAWGTAPEAVAGALRDPRRAIVLAALQSTAGTPAVRAPLLLAFEADVSRSDSPSDWSNLGVLKAMAGDLPGAKAAFARALRLEPTFADARDNLVIVEGMER